MHFAIAAILQLLCCVHAYRSGQERYWIFIILCFPVLGCVVYFLMVMLPETGTNRHSRSLLVRLLDKFNPDFQSADGHLLFARALAAQEKYDAAEKEFEVLVEYFPGPEARIHYADMLANANRIREANDQYVTVINVAKRSRPQYRKFHRQWIQMANEKLKQSTVR